MMILLINVERENSLHIHSFKKKYNTVTYTKELTKQIKKKIRKKLLKKEYWKKVKKRQLRKKEF